MIHAQRVLISIKNLCRQFDNVNALLNVDLNVHKGEWLAIMGPSGSGKSTLLNILSCLDSPTDGDFIFDGINTSLFTESERALMRREKVGLIFQQFHLIPYLNALENVMLAQYFHSMVDEKSAIRALQDVGLGDRLSHLSSQLSGGEKQRVCIARALINDPPLILADEPTGNLDEVNEVIVLDIFKRLHEKGKSIIMVTHNPQMAKCAQRTIHLNHGKIQ